jgi:hypothetical protein
MPHPANHWEPLPATDAAGRQLWRPRRAVHPLRIDFSMLAVLELLVGFWVFLAPWMINFFEPEAAAANGFGAGAILILGAVFVAARASATSTLVHPVWLRRWSVVVAALGAWTIASPWILGFASNPNGLWNQLGSGIAMIGLGAAMFAITVWLHRDGAVAEVPDPEAHILDARRDPDDRAAHPKDVRAGEPHRLGRIPT